MYEYEYLYLLLLATLQLDYHSWLWVQNNKYTVDLVIVDSRGHFKSI